MITILLLNASLLFTGRIDSIAVDTTRPSIDSVQEDVKESEFQESINTLFPQNDLGIDTTGWNTSRINAMRFDYTKLTDTIKIPLVDSVNQQFFTCPFQNVITSPFGPRHGFWHFGTDMKVKTGDTIRCALDGMVRVIQYDRYGYGRVLVIRNYYGIETLYGHLSRLLVEHDQVVKAGDPIALGGNTGRSTGSHLHFEMRYRGEPFDPGYIIDFETFQLRSDTLVLTRDNFEYLTELRKTVYHKVHRGETLSGIARRYSTSVRKICALNGISSRTILKIGRRLVVRKFEKLNPEVTTDNSETDKTQKSARSEVPADSTDAL